MALRFDKDGNIIPNEVLTGPDGSQFQSLTNRRLPTNMPTSESGREVIQQGDTDWSKMQQNVASQHSYQNPWVQKATALDLGRTPDGGAGINKTQTEIGMLPAKYNPELSGHKVAAQRDLAGYGGFQFAQDDPTTAEREDLTLGYKKMGINAEENRKYRETEAMNRMAANQRGMMYSSFAKKNLATAFDKLAVHAQAVVGNYMSGLFDTSLRWQNDLANLSSQLTDQYGQAAQWLLDNPPPPPPDEFLGADGQPGPGGAVHKSWTSMPNFDMLKQRYPGYIFDTKFDGKQFITTAMKTPDATAWDSGKWAGAAENSHHTVWAGYGKPDIEAIKAQYPDADIDQNSIRETEDASGNKMYEVVLRKQYGRADSHTMSSGDYVNALNSGQRNIVVQRSYEKPDMNAINGPMYWMSNNELVERKDKEGRTYYEVIANAKPGGGGGGAPAPAPAPPPPAPAPAPRPSYVTDQNIKSGRFTLGGNRSQQDATQIAIGYSQATGQHWSISKQNGQWVIYRV